MPHRVWRRLRDILRRSTRHSCRRVGAASPGAFPGRTYPRGTPAPHTMPPTVPRAPRMTDAQALALILVLVYLADCVVWVRNGGVLFSSPTRAMPDHGATVARPAVAPRRADASDWTATIPREASAVLRGGLVLGTLLPPLGNEFVVPSWPVSLAPDGVLPFVAAGPGRAAAPDDVRLLRWDELSALDVDGVTVRAGARVVAVAPSEAAAVALADRIEDLAATSADARPDAIRAAIRARLDTAAAGLAVDEWRCATRAHRVFANVLFALLAIVVAALAGWAPAQVVWMWAALAALPVHVVTVRLASRAHVRLRPAAKSERRRIVWTAALSPLSAIRSGSSLSKDVLVGIDPVVAAHLLCPPDAFRDFATRLVADLRLPRLPRYPTSHPASVAAEAWFRDAWRDATEAWLRTQGIDPDALLAPPPKRGDRVVSWCPRCRTCYDIPPGACEDCGGIPLVAWEPAAPAPSAGDTSQDAAGTQSPATPAVPAVPTVARGDDPARAPAHP